MADKTIGELPVIPSLNDDSLIPVEQNGAASHMTGLQIRQFAENVVQDKVAEAQGYAEQAEAAANGIEEVRNQAEKAATSSEEAAQRAEAAAADVEQAVSDAAGAVREQVAEDANRAEQASNDAKNAAQTAANDASVQVEQNLAGYVTNAQKAASNAENAQRAAEQAAQNAANDVSEQLAEHVTNAQTAQEAAEAAQAAAEEAAREAEGIAGGGVTSFNGRSGAVTPEKGDYSADDITFSDGSTFQEKYDSGELKGKQGEPGNDGNPGQDGTSVTVTNVSESTADGGSNVVTFSDGKTLTVKNGSKGSDGDPAAGQFVVTIRYDGSEGGAITADKTFAEMKAAYDAGQNVILRWDNGGGMILFLPLYCIVNDNRMFFTVVDSLISGEDICSWSFMCYVNDSWAATHMDFTIHTHKETDVTISAATDYTTVRVRGIALAQDEAVSVPNGCLCGVYTVS